MSKGSDAVKKWRKTAKLVAIGAMGSKCQICGYDRCQQALELHHIDPESKMDSISAMLSHSRNWKYLYEELEKCVLLCANCHREVHIIGATIPDDHARFDREEADRIRTERNGKKIKNTPKPIMSDKIEDRKKLILNSGISLTEWGAKSKLAELVGISPQKIMPWIKKHMPEII